MAVFLEEMLECAVGSCVGCAVGSGAVTAVICGVGLSKWVGNGKGATFL